MGARSETQVVRHPWPAVYEGLVNLLPANGFDLVASDPAVGRLVAETKRQRITISTGAIDAITTEWVVDVESKLGLGDDHAGEIVARLAAALELHLVTYYGG